MAPTPYAGTSGVELSGDFNDGAVFPDDLGAGSSGGPEFKTTVNESLDGERSACVWWGQPLHYYSVVRGERPDEKMTKAMRFYRLRGGAAQGFRFRDPFDNSTHPNHREQPNYLDPLHQVVIGAGDGVTNEFRLLKRYRHAGYEVERPITHTYEVQPFVNGFVQTLGVHYAVNHEAGVISFENPPPAGQSVTWAGRFHVPVRFTTQLDLGYRATLTTPKAARPPVFDMIEIRKPILWTHPKHASNHRAWDINDVHMITLSQGRMQTIKPLRDGLTVLLPRASAHPRGDEILTVLNGSDQFGLRIVDADENEIVGGLAPRGWAEFLLRDN